MQARKNLLTPNSKARREERPPSGASSAEAKGRVLIVEDDPLIVEVLVASLELAYCVSSVNTVGAALAFLRTSHVDVAIIDKILPDGRGTEVACLASNIGAVVIEMSGYPQEMDHLEHSAHLHLLKPFGIQALLSTIENALLNATIALLK